MIHDLAETARELAAIAASLAELATGIGRQADDATTAARQSNEDAGQSLERLHQLIACAERIEQGVGRQQQLIDLTRGAAEQGGTAINRLARSAAGIGSVSTVIGGIAGQSRMLALNARIEAARAGDAGRGFAVVASAVRDLSDQTAAATREIDIRADTLAAEMGDVAKLFAVNADRAEAVGGLVGEVIGAVQDQRFAAADAVHHCSQMVEQADHTAATMGRLATTASMVGMIAGQIALAAETLLEKADRLQPVARAA